MSNNKYKAFISETVYLDLLSGSFLSNGSVQVKLTRTDYQILTYFLSKSNVPISREELAQYLWGDDCLNMDLENVTKYISRVKKKLQKFDLEDSIENIHGTGKYIFHLTESDATEAPSTVDINCILKTIKDLKDVQDRLLILSEKILITTELSSKKCDVSTNSPLEILSVDLEKRSEELDQIKKMLFASGKLQKQANDLTTYLHSVRTEIADTEDKLEMIIAEQFLTYDSFDLYEILENLPETYETAMALEAMVKQYDLPELYEIIFAKYQRCFETYELKEILLRAQNIFEPFVWKQWFIEAEQ